MIRKWFKFHTSFVEVLKNSAIPRQVDPKLESSYKKQIYGNVLARHNVQTCASFSPFVSAYSGQVSKQITISRNLSDPLEHGDGPIIPDSEESTSAVAETPASTQLFQIKGPNGSAFLVEVYQKDLEEVKERLNQLKGNYFQFDGNVIERFTIKCLLMAEPVTKSKDQVRLSRIHGISSGSEEVLDLGNGSFMFVNSVDRTMRVKRILEKLGYNISGILYRFQPSKKIDLPESSQEVCQRFLHAVEQIPKVISVTHNV